MSAVLTQEHHIAPIIIRGLRRVRVVLPGILLLLALGWLPVSIPTGNATSVPDAPDHQPVGGISRTYSVMQQFPAEGNQLASIAILFGTYQRANPGQLEMTLRMYQDGRWTTLVTQQIEKATLRDVAYTTITFPSPLPVTFGAPLQLILRSDGTDRQAVTCFVNPGWQRGGFALSANGEPHPGAIVFQARYAYQSGHLVSLLRPAWQRVTLLLDPVWEIVLGAALLVVMGGVVGMAWRAVSSTDSE